MSNRSTTAKRTRAAALSAILLAAVVAAGCGPDRPTVSPEIGAAVEIREVLEEGGGGGVAKQQQAAEPTGFATVRGAFKFSGSPPPRDPLDLKGDDAPVCRQGGQTHLDEAVVVGPGGAMKNVLLFISSEIPDSPKWIHESYATAGAPEPFDQKGCLFLSHVHAMRADQTLPILNSDPIGHNTNISGGNEAAAFNTLIPTGGEVGYKPGGPSGLPMSVTCNIHPWMKAYLMVVGHPYFQVTGDDGKFELANVPAGVELELRAWQETNQMEFSDADGPWSRGRKTVTLQPGQELQLDITVVME